MEEGGKKERGRKNPPLTLTALGHTTSHPLAIFYRRKKERKKGEERTSFPDNLDRGPLHRWRKKGKEKKKKSFASFVPTLPTPGNTPKKKRKKEKKRKKRRSWSPPTGTVATGLAEKNIA